MARSFRLDWLEQLVATVLVQMVGDVKIHMDTKVS